MHCLINSVVQKVAANGLSVLGAILSMTLGVKGVAYFAGHADARLVNWGHARLQLSRPNYAALDAFETIRSQRTK